MGRRKGRASFSSSSYESSLVPGLVMMTIYKPQGPYRIGPPLFPFQPGPLFLFSFTIFFLVFRGG
jgi:hypothetical protein